MHIKIKDKKNRIKSLQWPRIKQKDKINQKSKIRSYNDLTV